MASSLKKQLLEYCCSYIDQKLAIIHSAIDAARESANDDTKSSAGDKHETGRAMAQLEQEKLSGQLAENLKQKNILNTIDPAFSGTKITTGSIVMTGNGNYFISISAGKVEIAGETYFLISAMSPIGKELMASTGKNEYSFNGVKNSIKKVL